MPFVVLVLGILLLLFLIIKCKLNTFISLIVTSVIVALGLGMNPAHIAVSIKNGIEVLWGNWLSFLDLVQ